MKEFKLKVGDVIRIQRFGYQHVGVYVGPRTLDGQDVVHNGKGLGVVLCTMSEFAEGKDVYLHKEAQGDARERECIAQRALGLIGEKFDLLNFNCEHAANLAQTSERRSEQVETAIAISGIAVLGLVAAALLGRRSDGA